jgi:ATP-binding cassette subfamily B protein
LKQDQTFSASASSPVERLLRPVRGLLWLAMFMAASGQVLLIMPLAAIAEIAHVLLSTGSAGGATQWILIASVASLCLGSLLITAAELIGHRADIRLTKALRCAIVEQLARLPLGWFSAHNSGQVKQLLQDDVATLHELTAHYFTTKARCVAAVIAPSLYLLWSDWRLSLICLLPFPLHYLLFGLVKRKISAERMARFVAGQNQMNAAIIEFVQGMPVLKTFAASTRTPKAYAQAVDSFARAFTDFTRPLVIPMANANAIIAPLSIIGVVLAAGAVFVINGWIDPVGILPFLLVTPAIASPLMLFGFLGHAVVSATAAAQRIVTVFDTPFMLEPAPSETKQPLGHQVRFENVCFSYGTENAGVSDITFTLEPGTVTAIVGPSGAGKSTLARLLLRFNDPAKGHVAVGGIDLRQMSRHQISRIVGFVLQDVQLINASVTENIALGRPSASPEEIEACARAADVHDQILALPRGYRSVIGEDASFSGGEAQRLCIARAMLLNAPVLVLDEATAAVDRMSEAMIHRALSSVSKDRTVLMIAHRLNTVIHADQILVMDQGRIVEKGNHSELLSTNGLYAQLWRAGAYDEG